MSLYSSRHHTEMHGFVEGSVVVDRYDDLTPYMERQTYTVVSIGGLYKDDHVQLDSKKTPWMIAGHYISAHSG